MSDDYRDCMRVVQDNLTSAKELVNREIADYPTPIAGCDVQYTRLLSDRKRIGNALQALEASPFVPTPRMLLPDSPSETS